MSIKPIHCGSRPSIQDKDWEAWVGRHEHVIPLYTKGNDKVIPLFILFEWFGKVTIGNPGHQVACSTTSLRVWKACPDFGTWSDGHHSFSTNSISGV